MTHGHPDPTCTHILSLLRAVIHFLSTLRFKFLLLIVSKPPHGQQCWFSTCASIQSIQPCLSRLRWLLYMQIGPRPPQLSRWYVNPKPILTNCLGTTPAEIEEHIWSPGTHSHNQEILKLVLPQASCKEKASYVQEHQPSCAADTHKADADVQGS